MTPWEERDKMTASLIRREIAEVRARALACGWQPSSKAWHRAFGELAGLHRALSLIDPEAGQPDLPAPQS